MYNLSQKMLSVLFPKYIWKKSGVAKTVYLTFDDGPIPEITEWVLDTLNHYNIKATFFCIGDNVRKHPEVFKRIVSEGHQVGNHTFNHLNGWKTGVEEYYDNMLISEMEMQKHIIGDTDYLFRPPYGKITKAQAKFFVEEIQSEIIMWTVLTKDYDARITPEQCLRRTVKRTKSGSIIVFHDSIKASKNMMYALPKTIEALLEKGYTFSVL